MKCTCNNCTNKNLCESKKNICNRFSNNNLIEPRFVKFANDINKMAELLIEQTSLDIRYPTYEVRPIGTMFSSKKKAIEAAKQWLSESE